VPEFSDVIDVLMTRLIETHLYESSENVWKHDKRKANDLK